MEKKLHKIVELGTAGCDYTGGGIWVAYIPVLIDGEKAELWYDTESYGINDKDTVEFSVFKDCGAYGYLPAPKYFDEGNYIGTKEDAPKQYRDIYKKLRKAIKKVLETDIPFDSKPL